MTSFSRRLFALLVLVASIAGDAFGQTSSPAPDTAARAPVLGPRISNAPIALHASSTMNVASEMGGAFQIPAKCDSDGNLYIRKYAVDRPLLGPVVKIDPDGKRTALFDPAAFSQLALDRADAFSPAPDGGIYRIAQKGVVKPQIYVLRFSSDGSPSSAAPLDADFEVYTFAAFAEGNFLVSGVKRDLQNRHDHGRNFTGVFSADGRELAQLSFEKPHTTPKPEAKPENVNAGDQPVPTLDLADAEVGDDGNLYVMRASSPALIYVIAPSGEIVRRLKVKTPLKDARPNAFHISGNRLALSFADAEGESQTLIVADTQTGDEISRYSNSTGLGPTFACFSANEGVFTFLKLGEGNELEVIRAMAD